MPTGDTLDITQEKKCIFHKKVYFSSFKYLHKWNIEDECHTFSFGANQSLNS
jgi:hypothetical protein